MNKQEAIEIVESRAFNIGDIDLACGLSYTKHIINQIDEPQKPVVPKFVADFYESIKDDFEDKVYELCLQYNRGNCELSSELYEWFSWFKNEPIQTLVEMKLYGYEIEQEKLYTVEIPSPNRTTEPIIYLSRDERGKIFLTSWFLLVGQNWKNTLIPISPKLKSNRILSGLGMQGLRKRYSDATNII